MGLHHGESPFHKTKSKLNWGNTLLHEVSGRQLHLTESRNSEKVDCFVTLILVRVQEEICLLTKYFYLDKTIHSFSPQRTLQM
jgi:hypothetical protein